MVSVPRTATTWISGVACLLATLLATLLGGCIEDPDCGICDPDNLVLQSVTASNYAAKRVHLLSPQCEGDHCPSPLTKGEYFVDPIGPCLESEAAMLSPRGPEEYCRLAPTIAATGLEFVFNNLLDPTSVELVRKRPDAPRLFEVYDWKSRILEIQGPITRYNGDYQAGRDDVDTLTRLVNLSCIDNLRDRGLSFSHDDYADPQSNPCNTVDGSTGLPFKLRAEGTITSARGRWDERAVAGSRAAGISCDTPQSGVDSCCSFCDFALTTQVAKYGVAQPIDSLSEPTFEQRRNPNVGTAIPCNPQSVSGFDPQTDDRFIACRDFVPWTDRSDEDRRYDYFWSRPPCDPAVDSGCQRDTFRLPYYDKLRETHPDDRPSWLEERNAPCTTTAECTDPEGHGLPGTECVGQDPQGRACDPNVNPDCAQGRCVAQWFAQCAAFPENLGTQGYCVDRRFSESAAGACLTSRSGFEVCDASGRCKPKDPGSPIAACDVDENGLLSAAECCKPGLGGAEACDPLMQPDLQPRPRYARNANLPIQTRGCVCEDDPPSECASVVDDNCRDDDGNIIAEYQGQYAIRFVTKRGGVVYDPAIKGIEWQPASVGSVPRAAIESCAEQRGHIGRRNVEDGWRANDSVDQLAGNQEDFNRAMCSGQTYRIVFATPRDGQAVEYIRDKVGNTLAGKATYVFETPQFHVVPGSGSPQDNLRVGACADFELRFSNQYDLSPENLTKLQIWALDDDGELTTPPGCGAMVPVAGGPNCEPSGEVRNVAEAGKACVPPCLTVDVSSHTIGKASVRIDPVEFGSVLKSGQRYRFVVPGLGDLGEMNDPDLYRQAFWDACGMPLILGGTSVADYLYDFTVDPPRCSEDADRDGIPSSCDNAKDDFNPGQEDSDRDGFGDVVDRCATVAGDNNTADSDRDGVGNECDTCRRTVEQYNDSAQDIGLDPYMFIRNVPFQTDTDGDGIGDVCDNCVVVANCEDYGRAAFGAPLENVWQAGDPIAFDDRNVCQRDDVGIGGDLIAGNMIGNACEGLMLVTAAGPVGVGPDDDFDQDGIANLVDKCPRQPLPNPQACTNDAECGPGYVCEGTLCNHLDTDGDDVGDACDSCPFDLNPMQVADGGMQMDDPDGDFVGNDCETNAACQSRGNHDARPYGFFQVASEGLCCTTQLVEGDGGAVLVVQARADGSIERVPLTDPDEVPVLTGCTEDQDRARQCRRLPNAVATNPGLLELPPGCPEALAAAGIADPIDNRRLTPEDFDGDLDALWERQCFLPQTDQDFDGLGEPCDLCPRAYDPDNTPFTDDNNRLWPNDGHYCNGDYADNRRTCGDEEDPGDGTGTDGGSTDSGGSDGGSTSG